MPGPGTTGGIGVQVDSGEWFRLREASKKYAPDLMTRLRKRIRAAGQFAVDDIRHTLGMPSPAGGPDSGEERAALAQATKVSISFGRRAAGARISTSNRLVSPDHKAILKTYNLGSFRHPVFGNGFVWVRQEGRPYFGAAFIDLVTQRAREEIYQAFEDAQRELESRIRSM